MKKKLSVGINILGHDSSVIHINENNLDIFAVENERISRFKHDGISASIGLLELKRNLKLENQKIDWDLSFCYQNEDLFKNNYFVWKKNILIHEIRKIFKLKEIKYQAEILKKSFYRILKESIFELPTSFNFIYLSTLYILIYKNKKKTFLESINKFLKLDFTRRIKQDKFKLNFYDHHTCHAASSFYFSPFKKCLSISLDFDGDKHFSKVILFNDEKLTELVKSRTKKDLNNNTISIGAIYSQCTEFLGYLRNSDEGKVEALAAYGQKNNELYKKLMDSTSINNLNEIIIKDTIIVYLKKNLENIKVKIGKENIAAAVQGYLEDFMTSYVKKIISEYKVTDVVLSGGTFANVKLNMNIYEKSGLENMYIVPAMSDAGAGLGALLLNLKDKKKISYDFFKSKKYSMPYWGPSFNEEEVLFKLKKYSNKINIKIFRKNDWTKEFAKMILENKIGGLFQGRMEFGPRALGNRSIIGNAGEEKTKDVINSVIKERPSFQPFCPSILEEDRLELFEKSYSNKHMTCAFKMKEKFAKMFPSAVHIDNTARPQFVSKEDNENLYLILKEIKSVLGYGVCVNTSFNKHGRTMVLTPDDAIKDFLDSKMDFIFFEKVLVTKTV